MNRESLYTARWHLLNGKPVPEGPALNAVLDVLRPILGPVSNEPQIPAAPPSPAPSPGAPLVVDWTNGDLPPIKDVVWMVPPGQRFPLVGAAFTLEQFRAYLAGIDDARFAWGPDGVTIHHTAAPSLAQRPSGFLPEHMRNLRSHYLFLGWDRGPHLFVDDHKIWVFSPLSERGIHAVSYNLRFFGIEMLGDYDREDPKSGRGAKVTALAAAAAVELASRFRLTESPRFHRDDPKTDKSCPGKLVTKDWFLGLMKTYAERR